MAGKKSKDPKARSVDTKRCPYCSTPIPMHVNRCFACGEKVGDMGKYGLAKKAFDWKGYLACLISFISFALFVWWAFF